MSDNPADLSDEPMNEIDYSSTSSSPEESTNWGKIIIIIIVSLLIIAGIVFVVVRFFLPLWKKKDKEEEEEDKKKVTRVASKLSTSQSQSNSRKSSKKSPAKKTSSLKSKKTEKTLGLRAPTVQVKEVNETVPSTASSSFAPPSTSNSSSTVADVTVSQMPEVSETPKKKENKTEIGTKTDGKEQTTVLCTYGNGWQCKTKPPKDFSFSIESD